MPGFSEYNVLDREQLPPEILYVLNREYLFSALSSDIFKYTGYKFRTTMSHPFLALLPDPQRSRLFEGAVFFACQWNLSGKELAESLHCMGVHCWKSAMGKLSWKPTGKSLVTDEHCPHSIFPLLLAILLVVHLHYRWGTTGILIKGISL